jgi:hypothetical protein
MTVYGHWRSLLFPYNTYFKYQIYRRDRFSMKKLLRSSARGASFHTKHALNVNAIETY